MHGIGLIAIDRLIIARLTDKNSKPTPQKVFTRYTDWIKVASENLLVTEPITYETLLKLNIRLGSHDVLESGPPPLPLSPPCSIPSSDATTNPVSLSTHELVEITETSATKGDFFSFCNNLWNIAKEI